MIWGGYPQVALSTTREEKEAVIKNIVNTYFLRDVQSALNLIDDYKLERLLRGLAAQIGGLIEYTDLANISETSVQVVRRYLQFLDRTYICGYSSPFYTNKRIEIVKSKKVYFYDTGLRNSIMNDFRSLSDRSDRGALVENAVWCQLVRKGYAPHYWRDRYDGTFFFLPLI